MANLFFNHRDFPESLASAIYAYCPDAPLPLVNSSWRGLEVNVVKNELRRELHAFIPQNCPDLRTNCQELVKKYLTLDWTSSAASRKRNSVTSSHFFYIGIGKCLLALNREILILSQEFNGSHCPQIDSAKFPLLSLKAGITTRKGEFSVEGMDDSSLFFASVAESNWERGSMITKLIDPHSSLHTDSCRVLAENRLEDDDLEEAFNCAAQICVKDADDTCSTLQSKKNLFDAVIRHHLEKGELELALTRASMILDRDDPRTTTKYIELLLETICLHLINNGSQVEAQSVIKTAMSVNQTHCHPNSQQFRTHNEMIEIANETLQDSRDGSL